MSEAALYVVATPIGNLLDITARAIDILKKVDLIAAEDTRHSARLMSHFDIRTPMISLHNHNERQRVDQLLARLQQGESIALISDAGTPLISDPGFIIVRAVRDAAIPVIPVPGCSAVITALCASGLPSDRFLFEGFLPAKKAARVQALEGLKAVRATLVFYESPHRILESLQDMSSVFGEDRLAVIARELTKTFETIQMLPLAEMIEWVSSDSNQQRGELVVLVHGEEVEEKSEELSPDIWKVLNVLADELPLKQAAALAAKITGEKKNRLYQAVLDKRTLA